LSENDVGGGKLRVGVFPEHCLHVRHARLFRFTSYQRKEAFIDIDGVVDTQRRQPLCTLERVDPFFRRSRRELRGARRGGRIAAATATAALDENTMVIRLARIAARSLSRAPSIRGNRQRGQRTRTPQFAQTLRFCGRRERIELIQGPES
jgi:hypothetical protein